MEIKIDLGEFSLKCRKLGWKMDKNSSPRFKYQRNSLY